MVAVHKITSGEFVFTEAHRHFVNPNAHEARWGLSMVKIELAFLEFFYCVLWVVFTTITRGPVGGLPPSLGRSSRTNLLCPILCPLTV